MIVILRFVLILIPFLAYGAPHLIDVTEEYDLDFTHSANPTDKHLLPEIMGSGAAIFDADNDGDLDFFFANYGANKRVDIQMKPNTQMRTPLLDGRCYQIL